MEIGVAFVDREPILRRRDPAGWREHSDTQEEAKGIDQDVPLIEALRVERRVPFCAALAVWLSIIAVGGLASRPVLARCYIERVMNTL